MSNATSFVTGGAGFVGSALVRQLLDAGEKVIVYDNFSFGNEENLPPGDGICVVRGDICDSHVTPDEDSRRVPDQLRAHVGQIRDRRPRARAGPTGERKEDQESWYETCHGWLMCTML